MKTLNFQNPPTRTEFLGFGKVTVPRNTARRMRDLIREASTNEYVRKWAEKIVEDVADRNEYGEMKAIFNFIQDRTRYAKDPKGVEYIQTPPYVLTHIQIGDKPSLDCDDYTVLGLSLLGALGYETAIRVTGYKSDGKFTHVYGMVKWGSKWIPFDGVRKDRTLGWQAPDKVRVMDVRV